jgi:serine/threonine protein phosphatase 1
MRRATQKKNSAAVPKSPDLDEPMTTSPAPRVLRLAANTKGRDFVVGDIHGAYNSVLAAMKAANFDGSRDRLLSVGDLIDRGADSWRCARFLGQPYVHAVRGNHEDMLLELYKDGEPDEAVLQVMSRYNGFGWWLGVSKSLRREILEAFVKLPTIIELETARGTVGLVHADIPSGMDWATFVQKVEEEHPEVLKTALWGRDRIQEGNEEGVEGIGRVFVGHTPQWQGLQRFGNIYAVDTGAIFGEIGRKEEGRLTFADVACKTVVLMAPKAATLIDIREDPLGTSNSNKEPFGRYMRQRQASV